MFGLFKKVKKTHEIKNIVQVCLLSLVSLSNSTYNIIHAIIVKNKFILPLHYSSSIMTLYIFFKKKITY